MKELKVLFDYVKALLDEFKKSFKRCDERLNHLDNSVEKSCKRIIESNVKWYVLVGKDGTKIYPEDCHNDVGYSNKSDFYTFTSRFELNAGDYIRVHDDTFHLGMAKIVQRIYDWNTGIIYLVCVNADEKDDFAFSDKYRLICEEYISKENDKVYELRKECEENGHSFDTCLAVEIVESCLEGKSCLSLWNQIEQTRSIVCSILELEYKRPSRYEFNAI